MATRIRGRTIRLHLCTGPCGQSMQVMTQRERINRVLLAVMANLPVVDGMCEHGTADGEFCEPCNREMKAARNYEENR